MSGTMIEGGLIYGFFLLVGVFIFLLIMDLLLSTYGKVKDIEAMLKRKS